MNTVSRVQAELCQQDDRVLNRFYGKLMNKPYASEDKDAYGDYRQRIMPKADAVKLPMIEFNGPKFVYYLTCDLDKPAAGAAWIDANVPQPTMIMVRPSNGHAHYAWELSCTVDRNNLRQYVQYRRVWHALATAVGADMVCRRDRGLLKNPLHENWQLRTYDRRYTFAELTEYLELPTWRQIQQARVIENDGSRNLTLRDTLAVWGKQNVRLFDNLDGFRDAMRFEAEQISQQFANPLSPNEVRKWVRSSSQFVWRLFLNGHLDEYNQCQRCRPMNLPPDLPMEQRQRMGQEYTSKVRTDKTRDKIIKAIASLRQKGFDINRSSVSRESGLSRSTVQHHWSSCYSVASPTQDIDVPVYVPDIVPAQVPVHVLDTVPAHAAAPVDLPIVQETEAPAGPSSSREAIGSDHIANTTPATSAAPIIVPISDSQHYTPMTYQQVTAEHESKGQTMAMIEAMKYAMQVAREHGIVIDGLPASSRSFVQAEVETFAHS